MERQDAKDGSEIYSREFSIPDGGAIRIKFEVVPAADPDKESQGVTNCCLKAEVRSRSASTYKPWFKRVPFSWLRLEDFLALCKKIWAEAVMRISKFKRKHFR